VNDKIRVGIIGTGRVGIDWHLPDIRAAGGEVVALADIVEGRAARFAAQHGVPRAYDDYRELLRLTEVDVVAVCTPPYTHAELAIAAVKAGKHLYLEKPPAMNEAEMVQIARAVRRAGQLAMTGSNRIYEGEVQALKRRLDAGELGHVYLVECLKLLRRSIPKGWHREKVYAGGGVGFNSTAHRIDLVLYLLGTPKVTSVTARTYNHFIGTRPPPVTRSYLLRDVEEGLWTDAPADVEDTLIGLIQFDTGCTCLLRDASAANMPDEWQVRLYGTEAGASLDPLVLYEEAADGLATDTRPTIPADPKGAHVLAYRHFFECIREGVETQSPPERSVTTMRILDALYHSAADRGRQVRFEEDHRI
jgi:predicted dehydrogenase